MKKNKIMENNIWLALTDLLKASMSIYDKRVDNFFWKTNKINDGISRYNTDGSVDEDNI